MKNQIQFCLSLFICLLLGQVSKAQSEYKLGWEALDNADVTEAIKHFQSATEDKETREKALLCLTLLESYNERPESGAKYFEKYFNESKDPFPALYALWFQESVIGDGGRKTPFQYELLKAVEKSPLNKGRLDAATQYRLGTHEVMSFDRKGADKYYKNINAVNSWSFLGPFDNVMNSGFEKDLGVVEKPEDSFLFTSKYGGEVSWFAPTLNSNDGYTFKDMFFLSSNSIVYAQNYVQSEAAKEAILKFGYSGSFKLWLNDELVYSEAEKRDTELDYFRFKVKLNKGFNRILIQLGDHDESYASFGLRFTDLDNNPLVLPISQTYQPYEKSTQKAVSIPYFATAALEKLAKEEDGNLYKILLAKAYKRSNELSKSEEILLEIIEKSPKNYMVLRDLILVKGATDDDTNRSKYYVQFKETYPNDPNILSNEISDKLEEKDHDKVKELIETYKKLYPNPITTIRFNKMIAEIDENNDKLLSEMEKYYKKYPNEYDAVTGKYSLEKNYYNNPGKANQILETYLKNKFNYNIAMELANNYLENGSAKKTIELLEKVVEIAPYSIETVREIVNIHSRASNYAEAIKMSKELVANRPSDYNILQDLAMLHTYSGKESDAISYYEESLRYYPFNFETNEKIRELKTQTKIMDLVEDFDPMERIKDYEDNYVQSVKKSHDFVAEEKSFFIYKTKATGYAYRYILKINNEKGIERWQKINLGSSYSTNTYIDEAKTIKMSGEKLNGERNGNEIVFTNLEVGDYIYLSYTEKQRSGGKSSLFIDDQFFINSYNPVYKIEYNIYVEDGLKINHTMLNDDLKPVIDNTMGFTKYTWAIDNPEVIKEESHAPEFSDLAKRVHVSLDYSWKEIVQWYSDLSTHQATPDFTIKKLAKEMFDGKEMTEEEKAKEIYEFVCKNIQYSSIDFRQSGHIPQKASKVYHSRLGDCKDVSTLYVSIAREVGLNANLVLINTSDNGENDVILPSLNFNHCIVKVYLDKGPKFLELTDPNLPYGHLKYYHQNAAILEIPTKDIPDNIKLEKLKLNPGYTSSIVRKSTLDISDKGVMKIRKNATRTGAQASYTASGYFHLDEQERKDNMKKSIAKEFKSTVTLDELSFEVLEPLKDTANYIYAYTVDKDVLNLGSYRTFKIPFADILIRMTAFDDGERVHQFEFSNYENTEYYEETIDISIDPSRTLIEIPSDVKIEYKGTTYDLSFKKVSPQKLKVVRKYTVNRRDVSPEEFEDFKAFMVKVNEGENTHLLFQ